jgi:ketosteroid isomerase-like protein
MAMREANVEQPGRANIEALRPVYEAWGRGDFRPRFDVYAPEMEWGWSEEFPGLEGVSRDPELRSERLRSWLSGWEDWRCEVEEMIASGPFVVAVCRYTGRGRASRRKP